MTASESSRAAIPADRTRIAAHNAANAANAANAVAADVADVGFDPRSLATEAA